MPIIEFQAIPHLIDKWLIIKLPQIVSDSLPSRGMVMVEGHINKVVFHTPLEPDGKGSHWFRLTDTLILEANLNPLQTAVCAIQSMKKWPEPTLPKDIKTALEDSGLESAWHDITTKARWEWIRWIQSTANSVTRKKRIDTAISKLKSGKKRPCCFDQSKCTEPQVCKSGILLES